LSGRSPTAQWKAWPAGCGVEQVGGALGPQDAQEQATATAGELVADGVQAWSVRPVLVDVNPLQPPAAGRPPAGS